MAWISLRFARAAINAAYRARMQVEDYCTQGRGRKLGVTPGSRVRERRQHKRKPISNSFCSCRKYGSLQYNGRGLLVSEPIKTKMNAKRCTLNARRKRVPIKIKIVDITHFFSLPPVAVLVLVAFGKQYFKLQAFLDQSSSLAVEVVSNMTGSINNRCLCYGP